MTWKLPNRVRLIVMALVAVACFAACDSGSMESSNPDPEDEQKRPIGELQAILEADTTYGPPHYQTVLRAVCSTNGGSTTIAKAHLMGPFDHSPGFTLLDTGSGLVGDTLSITVSKPGKAQLRCQSDVGHSDFASLSFGGLDPQLDLSAFDGMGIPVFEETSFEVTDYLMYADTLYMDDGNPPSDVDFRIEQDVDAGRTWIHVRPNAGSGSIYVDFRAENGFGSDVDDLRLQAEFPAGMHVEVEDWISGDKVAARISILDASGHSMREADVVDGEAFFDFRDFPSPISSIRVEPSVPGYFSREIVPVTDTDETISMDIPVLPKAPCLSLFSGDADPLASCLEMTGRLMFSPLYEQDALEGFHADALNRANFRMIHHETGSVIPGEWVAAVRAAAGVWESAGIPMDYPLASVSDGTRIRVARDAMGRLVAAAPGNIVYVADDRPGAKVVINFLTNENEVRSALVLLPVQDDPTQWQAELEWARIRTEYVLADDAVFGAWDEQSRMAFLAEWIVPLHKFAGTNVGIPAGAALDEAFPQ